MAKAKSTVNIAKKGFHSSQLFIAAIEFSSMREEEEEEEQ